MKSQVLLLGALSFCAPGLPAGAADWPQWRGPDRNDVSREAGLLKSWPEDGPRLLWTYTDTGIGYSGPAVVGEHLYTMGARDEKEYVIALDTATGKEAWARPVGPRFQNGYGDGPRGTPTVDDGLLFAIGGQGELVCLDRSNGNERWRINLRTDLGGEMMSGWGYTESPLVDGDKVICTPGGAQGSLAALNKNTGKVLWRSKDLTDSAAYSSPVVAEVGGVRQYIQMTGQGQAGVAAEDGRLLWHAEEAVNGTAIIPTPVIHENLVFVSSGYGAGCGLIRLTANADGKFSAEEVYANKSMVNHHGGVVLLNEHLYGYSDGKGWICQDFKTGKIVWSEKRKLGKGSITCADGLLYCYGEQDGTVVLAEASPDGWKEHGRFKIPRETTVRSPRGKIWTHPVVANGRLYLRDQDLLFCYDVKDHGAGGR
jgi:outer membrane protein assembly factor BamB